MPSRRFHDGPILMLIGGLLVVGQFVMARDDSSPPAQQRREWTTQLERLTRAIERDPRNVDLYSQRGDVHFFLGHFAEAVADYDRMIELRPELDTSHWRRGIACFYAGRYADAAAQFERYHSFDDVDRENGIWRYLSQAMDMGPEAARSELLRYEKDDREPFADVYRLFAGTMTPEDILARIAAADIDDQERAKREFYAHLYIGLHLAVQQQENALQHLKTAAENSWAPAAGYGPRYMWHVARLHAQQLAARSAEEYWAGYPKVRCGCNAG